MLDNMVHLNSGYDMPRVMFGTWDVRGARGQEAIESALAVGYRGIDTAFMYENHDIVCDAIRASGIPRSELFVTTKLNSPYRGFEASSRGIETALAELGLDYLDLVLVHEPYLESVEMYHALERAVDEGIIRSIGVSSFDQAHLAVLLERCEIVPAVNQCESHVYYPQLALKSHLDKLGIVMQAWAPFTEGQRAVFAEPALIAIAKKHDAAPAQVALAYLLQQGIAVCVKSASAARQQENLAVLQVVLDDDDIAMLAQLDEGASLFGWYDDGWI